MDIDYKIPGFSGKNTIIALLVAAILSAGLLISDSKTQGDEALLFEFQVRQNIEKKSMRPSSHLHATLSLARLAAIQKNTLLPIANISNPEPKTVQRIRVIATAYSSTVWQTDDTPFITASNTWVRKGIIANNFFPFGTRVRIPEFYGDKIFVVEDRMHWRKSNYHIDIWFPSLQQAKNFGIKKTYIEILEG